MRQARNDKNKIMPIRFKKLIFLGFVLPFLIFGSGVIGDINKSFSEKEDFKSNGSFYVTINDNNLEFKIPAVKGATTQNVLAGSDIKLSERDILMPGLKDVVFPGSKIIIQRAIPVKIISDGEEKETSVFGSTVEDALLENGIKLAKLDKIEPKLEEAIYTGIEIKVIRVTREIVSEKFEIPYQTVERLNNKISYGKIRTVQRGENGKGIKTLEITCEDGQEVSRKLISSKTVKAPQTKIIEKGTKIVIGRVQNGIASWYARGLYNPQALTAASRNFPRGTFLRVTNLANNKSVIVKVNDYVVNPLVAIDLSVGAFKKIANKKTGKIKVRIEEIL